MVFARILLAENRPGDALRILEGLAVEGNEQVPMAKRIEVPILQALIHSRLQQGKQASARLQFALELAQPGGYIRPFLEQGAPIYALLKNHKKQPGTRAFQQQLREAFDRAGYRPERVEGAGVLPEPLTEREVEVLTYLQSELTVPEIAEHLSVAESTVRTHIKNVYGKLQAHSRHEALARAREFDLL
jgi:LuxR family maltose regulon positive regulatory protein